MNYIWNWIVEVVLSINWHLISISLDTVWKIHLVKIYLATTTTIQPIAITIVSTNLKFGCDVSVKQIVAWWNQLQRSLVSVRWILIVCENRNRKGHVVQTEIPHLSCTMGRKAQVCTIAIFEKQQTFELINTFCDPIITDQVSASLYNQTNELECQNRHFNQLIIRDNTTSMRRNQINKLEKWNQSNLQIMEYHDFLFDMGVPEPRHRPSDSGMWLKRKKGREEFHSNIVYWIKFVHTHHTGTMLMSIFGLISFIVAMMTIRYMFKIFFFNDHVSELLIKILWFE